MLLNEFHSGRVAITAFTHLNYKLKQIKGNCTHASYLYINLFIIRLSYTDRGHRFERVRERETKLKTKQKRK